MNFHEDPNWFKGPTRGSNFIKGSKYGNFYRSVFSIFLLTCVKMSKTVFMVEMLRSWPLIWYPYCYSFVTFYDRHKCQNGNFMTLCDIYDDHEMSRTYSNMGIKKRSWSQHFSHENHFRKFYSGEEKNRKYQSEKISLFTSLNPI